MAFFINQEKGEVIYEILDLNSKQNWNSFKFSFYIFKNTYNTSLKLPNY